MEQEENLILKKKIQAFKTIYRAINEALPNTYNDDFLAGKEYLSPEEYVQTLEAYSQIKKSKKDKIYSHVYQAWRLAKIHYDACREDNEILFNDIYNCICKTQRSRYRIVRYMQKKPKTEADLNPEKKPTLLSKLNFFKNHKQTEPSMIEMDEFESKVKIESFSSNSFFENKNLTLQEIDNKKLNSEIIFSIYYHLANPIPSGEIWARPRAELRF